MRQKKFIWLGQPVGEEKNGEKKRKRRKKRKKKWEKTKPRYVFILKSWVFWIPKVLVWRLVTPYSRVLWRDHPNPRIVEVMGEKPQLVKIKHGILLFIWFLEELVDLRLNSWDFYLGFDY